jgi:hypothetical protein
MKKYKMVKIEEEFHTLLKDYKKKTGISIKVLIETAVKYFLKRIVVEVKKEEGEL